MYVLAHICAAFSYLLESSPGWLSLCGNASVGLFVAFTSPCEGKIWSCWWGHYNWGRSHPSILLDECGHQQNSTQVTCFYPAIYLIFIQLFKKCTIWSVIKSFTNIEFTELSGDNINSLTNVITLDALLHKSFGSLHLWFEAVPVCWPSAPLLCHTDWHLVMLQRVRITATLLERLMTISCPVCEASLIIVVQLHNSCRDRERWHQGDLHFLRPREPPTSWPTLPCFPCRRLQSCPYGGYGRTSWWNTQEVWRYSSAIRSVKCRIPWWAATHYTKVHRCILTV